MSEKKLVENMVHVRKRINTPRSLLDFGGDVIGGEKNSVNRNVEITQLVSDSRRVTNGSAFFALPGLRTDGNRYVKEALERGARAIITEDDSIEVPSSVVKVCVKDARKTLARLSRRYFGCPDESLEIVGVTGTNGKTTVSTLVRHLLEEEGRPVGLIGTVKYSANQTDWTPFFFE